MAEATVLRVDARGALVSAPGGPTYAQLRGALFQEATWATRPVAVGDRVGLEGSGRDLTIARVLPRRNQLVRLAKSGGPAAQVIATNVDGAAILASLGKPNFSSTFVDRVLATAAACEIPTILVLNKTDEAAPGSFDSIAATYRKVGIEAVAISAKSGAGLDALRARLGGRVTVLTGPSGVGKTTLINVLLGNGGRPVGHLSWKWQQGKHTTSSAEWVDLPDGGAVIDTPGIRNFSPWGVHRGSLRHCFPDLDPLVGKCRFADCAHQSEPGCALAEAVARGELAPTRVASYQEIYAELEPPPEEWSEGARPRAAETQDSDDEADSGEKSDSEDGSDS
jgi:ribosome biogenesis GTPase